MSIKEMLSARLLEAFSAFCPEASARDLKFFGDMADVSAPLPAKYGLDMDEATVYTIINGTTIQGRPLLQSLTKTGGYLSLTLSRAALEALADEAIRQAPRPVPDEAVETGPGLASVRTRLMDIAEISDGVFYEPHEPVMRSAFLHCIFADSPASLSIALSEADEAIRRHRRAKASGRGETLSGRAALAMAVCLYLHKTHKIP